ncbi:unnamed protein product [Fraxinus pennsylvanica]|uniref:Small auxin up regulated protein n=1 Tax=Fraxinus pennsylvanica TaxID=56036 RepID=A0AAD2E7X7_9LAMI|nr:unnamed protein product [Fraxinus pennsylvanica]
MSVCSKIRHLVTLRRMLRQLRKKAAAAMSTLRGAPSDVPVGHVAVTVGSSCKRFVVRATYLNHPLFKKLLVQAQEEYGFTNTGPLAIPCDESLFEEVIRYLARTESNKNYARFMTFEDFQRYRQVGILSNFDFRTETSKIRHLATLRRMLRQWRKKAAAAMSTLRRVPSDVPVGHVAVTVGSSCKRFVVRATYLNHPLFKKLLVQAHEEYGFTNTGPLAIPCDESLFEEVLRYLARTESNKNSARFMTFEDFQRYRQVGILSNFDFRTETRSLLHG